MKLVTYRMKVGGDRRRPGERLGVQTDNSGLLDVAQAKEAFAGQFDQVPDNMMELLRGGRDAFDALKRLVERALDPASKPFSYLFAEELIEWGPCVPEPGKIICVGTNYRKHAEESNMPIPQVPILFNKFANTIAAHGETVPLPFNTGMVDYEAELGVVIGRRAHRVGREEALDYVFGYCNVNDLSARDLQFRTHQWLLGKTCDKFSPVGPYLVSADEVGDPNRLRIRCFVNGETRQDSNTADMVFACDELVSYISQFMTLEPGDLILTGTPEGVAFAGFDGKVCHRKPQYDWLQEGDEVTVEIEKLGRLTNRMSKEH